MAHNRAQLNALIFHNPVVLPRTSPGYGEMTIAVAELQGGNNAKAALYAESAVTRDPTLAAGWLAKTAADVFEATPDDLRQERALFCIDRALECAPACHREIIDFVVANILGHYVEVLCGGALAELAQWQELEAYAVELEDRALSLDWRATQMRGNAAMLAAAGLVTGMVALFSRRLGTQVFSGVASVVAFSEAARMSADAVVLEGMAAELRTAGYAQRLEGQGHRAASLRYLVPARDLIGAAARLLQAVGLPPQSLDRLVQTFTTGFRHVLSTHLRQLSQEIGGPMSKAIDGKVQGLAATYGPRIGPPPIDLSFPNSGQRLIAYGKEQDAIRKAAGNSLYTGLNPVSQDTMLWLENMMPRVRGLAAYHLLGRPLPSIAHWIYNFREGTRSRSLLERMEAADRLVKSWGCLLVILRQVRVELW